MLTILFDGIAYGMLLFILAVGLAVTMGLMNFINLAHGAFAMVGGYITVLLMQKMQVPFLLCLPLAFLGSALLGRGAGAHAVPPALPQAAPGPGAVFDRPDLHGSGQRGLLHWAPPSRSSSCPNGSRAAPNWAMARSCWAWGTTACSSSPCVPR
jgi:hypothetical protein